MNKQTNRALNCEAYTYIWRRIFQSQNCLSKDLPESTQNLFALICFMAHRSEWVNKSEITSIRIYLCCVWFESEVVILHEPDLICLHTDKQPQLLKSNTSNFTQHYSSVCIQLNSFKIFNLLLHAAKCFQVLLLYRTLA